MTYPFRRLAGACEEASTMTQAERYHRWGTDPMACGICYAASHFLGIGYTETGKAIREDMYAFDPVYGFDYHGPHWEPRLLYLYLRAEEQENP